MLSTFQSLMILFVVAIHLTVSTLCFLIWYNESRKPINGIKLTFVMFLAMIPVLNTSLIIDVKGNKLL